MYSGVLMALTDILCKTAKPSEKTRKLSDEKGLYLEVMPNGSKYWRMKFRFVGKENRLSFGVYPEVSLRERHVISAKPQGNCCVKVLIHPKPKRRQNSR